jgi:hypothetical protein
MLILELILFNLLLFICHFIEFIQNLMNFLFILLTNNLLFIDLLLHIILSILYLLIQLLEYKVSLL